MVSLGRCWELAVANEHRLSLLIVLILRVFYFPSFGGGVVMWFDKMEELMRVVHLALNTCLAVKPGEEVLVVTDEPLEEIGKSFYRAARELGAEALLLSLPPLVKRGEPPQGVAQAMQAAQVVVMPTSKSLSHTRARRQACQAGARIVSLPGATVEMLVRALDVDYEKMATECRYYAQLLTEGRRATLYTPAGTELTFSLEGRQGYVDSGLYTVSGSFGNLPAGEACIAPVEGTAEGILVIDGSLSGWGLLEEPLRLEVRRGEVVAVAGGRAAIWLEEQLNSYGRTARNIAELGIGLNPRAQLTGKVLEDEKVRGTVHIALGDNLSMGGKVEAPCHLDGVLLEPILEIDGQAILGGQRGLRQADFQSYGSLGRI
ncbi:aminopeptidase [Thermanaeromonas sp.]|uniref:aminopeptidase n=1 Tax=Thermanaeromonas sp. TaxID=2003697 RepID=UPI00261F7FB3|nr:aminopeptidase [Thermanaeromonas sp.]